MTQKLPPKQKSPWHSGEVFLQQSLGVAERMEGFGRQVIRDHMPDQHRAFYAQLPFLALGAVDADGNPWATLITGEPGFVAAPDPRRLRIAFSRDAQDPADMGMEEDAAVGLLGIELDTRRRNRMNGRLQRQGATGFEISVEHAFGNCPQYIQKRDWRFVTREEAEGPGQASWASGLDDAARQMIEQADTFFVASYVDRGDGHRQVDVSHRGGKQGFVRLDADGGLTIPDFAGNLHFNTLGNFLLNPKAGLLFLDFETGDVLQMTGESEVILDSPEIAAFEGAERLWRFRPTAVVRRRAVLPLRWRFEEWSPNSTMTGSWEAAAERLKAEERRAAWRPLRVTAISEESAVVRSFYLAPADDAGLIRHEAGQHLPIRVTLPGEESPRIRTYTISAAPSDEPYRITVKRDGRVSSHLYDTLKPGDVIEARAPAGNFTIDASARRPAVLLAGGIGVTPLVAMLRHIVHEGKRSRRLRPTWLIQAARYLDERAFDAEIDQLVAEAGGAVRVVRVLSNPEAGPAVEGVHYDHTGRVNVDVLKRELPFDAFDFYLCGPQLFMQSLYNGLRAMDVPDERIHAEAFGPASLKRRRDGPRPDHLERPAAATAVPVAFSHSGKEARWQPGSGTLLELAEAHGLAPEFSCRGGSCGTCRTRILEGAVAYTNEPSAEIVKDEALICCAVPAAAEDGAADRLALDL